MGMMTEALDLKLTGESGRFFKPGEATVIGDFCSVKLDPRDTRLPKLAELERKEWTRSGCGVVLGWKVERRYARSEITTAQLFRLITTSRFEPTGEECGTEYSTSTICPHCGAGRVQRSELMLDLRKLSKKAGLAVSLGGEVVVSQEMAEHLTDAAMTGFALKPVRHRAAKFIGPVDLEKVPSGQNLLAEAAKVGLSASDGAFYVWINRGQNKGRLDAAMQEARDREERLGAGAVLPVWHQLVPEGKAAVVAPTRFGINPLNDDANGEFRCPNGHTAGLSLLSEVTIDQDSWKGRDLCTTDALVGYHPKDSLVYPEPILLLSQRFRALLERLKVKGIKTEIAHVVTPR